MATSPLHQGDLTQDGAAAFNEVNAAVANLGIRHALASNRAARAIDLVLCDEALRREYVQACPVELLPVALAPAVVGARVIRMAPRLRVIQGGKDGSDE